ncbi:ATP-binding protein [Cyclobacteriaceae bacterium]|nr:ATP-binding protein [Cyclobacteriaceae bacterium]
MNNSITISCEKSNLTHVRDFLTSNLSAHICCEKEINLIILAIDEVCANIIIHEKNKAQTIEVSFQFHERRILFSIIHHGNSFDYNKYQEPNLEQLIEQKSKGGIGLILVNRIMDTVKSIPSTDHTEIILTKALAS